MQTRCIGLLCSAALVVALGGASTVSRHDRILPRKGVAGMSGAVQTAHDGHRASTAVTLQAPVLIAVLVADERVGWSVAWKVDQW